MAERAQGPIISLLHLPEGEAARVVRLDRVESAATGHLVALGVLPGVELVLVQRYPAFVIRMGNAEFAVDEELAGRIHVG